MAQSSWITYVEHTSFGIHAAQRDLAAQLAATKLQFAQDYAYDYILLIELEEIRGADVAAVRSLIETKGISYKVWLMAGRMQDDDEDVRVVTLNSPFEEIVANFRAESGRFRDAPGAFLLKLTEKDPRTHLLASPRPGRIR